MTEETIAPLRYNVMTVEKTTAPDGMLGDNWHRYVIGEGRSKIEGKKTGTLKDVTAHAKSVAEILNARNAGGGSTYAARKKS